MLKELALHGRMDGIDGDISTYGTLKLPALKYLHITSPFPPCHITSGLAVLTPALEYLRLSVPEHAEAYVSELQGVLRSTVSGCSGADGDKAAAQDTPALQLRTVLLHCPSKPRDNWMNQLDNYERQMHLLHKLKAEHAQTGLVKLAPPLKRSMFRTVTIKDAEEAWRARVLGRDAWWEDSKELGAFSDHD
ncbi:hypothetical protein D9758_012959 [Tetrapyrgos nigripes]|uniref:Uncharacterized protein n=1 Tax=Tetrapyrgos nigripes TaxID=182062 RepID=A0A8H5CMW9_9AGAR|nr:hypothetical protein D9758_012959 [Tetrapyrgos nigripes]